MKILVFVALIFSSILVAQDYDFSLYYNEDKVDYKAAISNEKEFDPETTTNYKDVIEKLNLNEDAIGKLFKNGFVIKEDKSYFDNYENFYSYIKNQDLPTFVTASTLTHYYHILFDELLKETEENYFYDDVTSISIHFRNYYLKKYKKRGRKLYKDVYKRNLIYFSVPLAILNPSSLEDIKPYKNVYDTVQKELTLIKAHEKPEYSPLFIYKEDYSQYVPRGHYTASDNLKKYFLSMMWYGRMTMLVKGDKHVAKGKPGDVPTSAKALISKYDAKVQTMQAVSITKQLAKQKNLLKKWDRMYKVTAFFVGNSDDLTFTQYSNILKKYFKRKKFKSFRKDKYFTKLQLKLAELDPPQIYGGTGDLGVLPPYKPEDLDKILSITAGFRLFGQKFVPDSYMFQQLVFPKVDAYLGTKKPFTMVMTPTGPTRGFPRGLDIFSVLKSQRAYDILKTMDDTNYDKYDKQLAELKNKFYDLSEKDWHKNLYWSWLYTLKKLNSSTNLGYPKFMKSTAWQDKTLYTSLASWVALRHDTILYAKQSYTPAKMTSIGPGHSYKMVKGYVEPLPEFYSTLLAITKMTSVGLEKMNILDNQNKRRLAQMSGVIEKLIKISVKELQNEMLTEPDYNMLNNFHKTLKRILSPIDKKALKTTLIADVHTDGNTAQALEEGSGFLNSIIVAVPMPDGSHKLFVGPEISYYEFKQPTKNRLDDIEWKRTLMNKKVNPPVWIEEFYVK